MREEKKKSRDGASYIHELYGGREGGMDDARRQVKPHYTCMVHIETKE